MKAVHFEPIIVDLWNIAIKRLKLPKKYSQYKTLFNNIADITKDNNFLVQNLPNQGLEITDGWKSICPEKTVDFPKTDIISDCGEVGISLKYGRCHIMSGSKTETIATFMYAANNSGVSRAAKESLIELFNQFILPTFTDIHSVIELMKIQDTTTLNDVNLIARNIIVETRKIHHIVQRQLKELFEKNKLFKQHFVYEAICGRNKFKHFPGYATHLMLVSKKNNGVIFEKIHSAQCNTVKIISDNIYMRASMKSYRRINGRSFYSALRIELGDVCKLTNQKKCYAKIGSSDGMRKYINKQLLVVEKHLNIARREIEMIVNELQKDDFNITNLIDIDVEINKDLYTILQRETRNA
ncbi:hypothetical protein [Microcystis phage Mel-JY01]